jgi:SNF2 family DNA or RNA helicase
MYRKVKRKIAASITNLDSPATKKKAIEISTPENWAEPVEAFQQAELIPIDFYKLNKPKYALVKINFPEVKLEESLEHYFFKKSKTNVVFFDFGRTKSKNVLIDSGNKTSIDFSASIISKKDGIYLQTKGNNISDSIEKLSTLHNEMKFKIEQTKNSGIKIEKGKPAAVKEITAHLEKDTPLEINFRPKTADVFGIYGKVNLEDPATENNQNLNEFIEYDFSLPDTYLDSSYYLISVPKIINKLEEQVPTVFEVSLSEAALSIGELDPDKKTDIEDFSDYFGLRTEQITETIDYLEKFKEEIKESLVSENKLTGNDNELPGRPATIDLLKKFKPDFKQSTISENILTENETKLPGRPVIIDILKELQDEVKKSSNIVQNFKLEKFSSTEVFDILGTSDENINELPAAASVTEVWENEYFSIPEIIYELTDIKEPIFEKPKLYKVTFQDFDPNKIKHTNFSNISFIINLLPTELKHLTNPAVSRSFKSDVEIKTVKSKIENTLNNYIDYLSQPSIDISYEDKSTLLAGLFDYQIEGVDFFSMNKRAILADDLGLGKTVQAIAALKLLIQQRAVKQVLVVAEKDELGSAELSRFAENPVGWAGNFDKWAEDLSVTIISGPKSNRKIKWNEKSQIKIIDYKSLQDDFTNKNLSKEMLNSFDCIIFDDFTKLFDDKDKYEISLKDCNPNFIWNLTSNISNITSADAAKFFSSDISGENDFKILHRTKKNVSKSLPPVITNDKWIAFDADQQADYKKALDEGRNQLDNFLSTGNILRFQANVLFLLHKLNQLGNFQEDKPTSRKSEVLLQQLKSIKQNNSQVIVFSNYDKQGTQQLENILGHEKIKYLKFLAGMSAQELSEAAEKFTNDKSITVLLASFKSAGAKKALPYAPYLIHFDPLWSPIAQWQIEDAIVQKSKSGLENSNLIVYNYRSDTEIERLLLSTLESKGFLNQNICDNISPQTFNNILSDDEWKNIIGLKLIDEKEKISDKDIEKKLLASIHKIEKLNSDQLVGSIISLFKSLGYTNVEVMDDSKKDGIIISCKFEKGGKSLSAKIYCALTENINHSSIKEFVHFQSSKPDLNRIFIISLYPLPADIIDFKNDKFTFIDRELLAKYLQHFNL